MSERATCHDHDQYYWADEGCPVCNVIAERDALMAQLEDAKARLAAAEAQVGALTNWRDDPESSEAWCAGNDYALTRLCKVLGVAPAKVSWDGSDGSLDEEADALIWRILHANDDEESRSPAIREAEARGMERAAGVVMTEGAYRDTHFHRSREDLAAAIRAAAAAHRKDEETPT